MFDAIFGKKNEKLPPMSSNPAENKRCEDALSQAVKGMEGAKFRDVQLAVIEKGAENGATCQVTPAHVEQAKGKTR